MKALFNRTFNRSSSLKDKDGTAAATAHAAAVAVASKEKTVSSLSPLPEWPPPSHRPPSSVSQPSLKPLPDLAARPLPTIQDGPPPALETESDPGSNARVKSRGASAGSGSTDIPKKVAFISPPSTPSSPPVRSADPSDRKTGYGASDAPLKTAVSRLQASHGADPRVSSSTATSSKTNLGSNNKLPNKATVTRGITTPPHSQRTFADGTSSLRSGSPYSTQSANTSSRILATASWSEAAEEDLVSNLGPRERTRQEVLWEIVASEERYVAELLKLKDTFIDPLLHPYATSPIASPTLPEGDDYYGLRFETLSPQDSADHLPIAARFLSPSPFEGVRPPPAQHVVGSNTPVIDGDSMDSDEEDDRMGKSYQAHVRDANAKINHPRSPYRARNGSGTATRNGKTLPFPSRSHHSLPPPPRPNQNTTSTSSLGRQSYIGPSATDERKTAATPTQRVLRKLKKSQTSPPPDDAIPPHLLPDDLRRCLEVIEAGILTGHLVLSEGLRKRYDEQYPLVRSLADVFVTNSHILREYATYVLHLERALEQVDDALSLASATKRPKKQTEAEWLKLSKYLQRLEESASGKAETGLAISLSKPFQRLLKYPLLFQNLLFHTDPSTFEYESTLQMVAEVETIVRSIEDEKIQKEERDRTRDVFARIEGLDKVKQLAVPKPSRLLVEEKMVSVSEPGRDAAASPVPKLASTPPPVGAKAVKGKSSFRRLSDALQSNGPPAVGGRKDLWLVVFNDVVLRCQRTGTTSLPLASPPPGGARSNSLPELPGKAKYATTGRRNSHTKPRNLYKFIKIETWAMIADGAKPRAGIVSMEDISRSRALVTSAASTPPNPNSEDDDPINDSDDSDRKSKMSFSYWGADKVTLSHPALNPRARIPVGRGNTRVRGGGPSSYTSRESSANAKFGSRLVHASDTSSPTRPASRKAVTPATKRTNVAAIEDAKATTTSSSKPAWDGSTRAVPAPSTTGTRRPRNLSQGSGQPPRLSKLASPAPSEDSGVGLYRQMMAQDPSLNL